MQAKVDIYAKFDTVNVNNLKFLPDSNGDVNICLDGVKFEKRNDI